MDTVPVAETGCCPRFSPGPWDEKEIVWKDKTFVKDHVHSLFHIPLDMGRKVVKNQKLIDEAGAKPETPMMLSDERSPWGSDIFIDVTKPVSGAEMTTVSGTFLTKVFEGPYRDAGKWVEEMRRYVASKGRAIDTLYFGYTMCPRCAKAYGKNYVVLFAKVNEAVASS